jgi:hypothetical protein
MENNQEVSPTTLFMIGGMTTALYSRLYEGPLEEVIRDYGFDASFSFGLYFTLRTLFKPESTIAKAVYTGISCLPLLTEEIDNLPAYITGITVAFAFDVLALKNKGDLESNLKDM